MWYNTEMIEFIYNKIRNNIRKLSMKIQRAKYGYKPKLPKDIKYFEGGMYDAIYEASCKWPHNTALEYSNLQVTYRELIKKINKVAKGLRALGVEKGDIVTICMPNTPEMVYMFYAINEVGAVASMIHPLSSEKEIEDYLNQTKSKVMLCIDVAYPRVEAIIKNTKLEHLIVTSATRSMEFIVKVLYKLTKGRKNHIHKDQTTMLWQDLLAKSTRFIGNPHVRVNSDDPAVVLYSGGTTGKSKGVVLSNMNFNSQALSARYYAPEVLKTENAFLTFLPNFHCFGLGVCTHVPLYHGMRVVLIPLFNAKKMRSYLKKYKFNVLCGIPTLFDAMTKMKFGKNAFKGLDAVIAGGDSTTDEQKKRIDTFLKAHGSRVDLRIGYGLTEATGVVAFSPIGVKSADIIGYALPDCDFMIRNLETGKEAPLGQDGEVLVAGPTVMIEYLNNAEETKNTFVTINKKKYLKTGDIGFIDEKGFLHFRARLKRMIITNGYNVYPSHVEEIATHSKYVEAAAVIGKPDKLRGEIVKIFVVLKDETTEKQALKDLKQIFKKHLAKYEQPREYRFVAELPKTKLNKIDFRALENED